jgi:hypothetical protein
VDELSGLAALVDYSMGFIDFDMAIYKSSSCLLHFSYVCQSISIIILLIIRHQNKCQHSSKFHITNMANDAVPNQLLERNKYESHHLLPNQEHSTDDYIRVSAAEHQPIPYFSELPSLGLDMPHTLIRKSWFNFTVLK